MTAGFVALTAAAAAAVPVAGARTAVDARHAGLLNREPIVRTDARHVALLDGAHVRVRVVQPPSVARDTASGRTDAQGRVSVTAGPGFDWVEAGVGAGLMLAAAGGVLMTRRTPATA